MGTDRSSEHGLRGLLVLLLVLGMALATSPATAQSEDDPESDPDLHVVPLDPQFGPHCRRALIPDAGFLDVPDGSTHDLAIDCAAYREVIFGVTPDRFAPARHVRRDQLASMVARWVAPSLQARGELPADPPDAFPDDDGNVHEPNIDLLAAVGVITPADLFRPEDPATRAEVADLTVRAFDVVHDRPDAFFNDYLPLGPDRFSDDDGHPLERSLDKAGNAGIIQGVRPGIAAPDALVRRDQTATFLMRAGGCHHLWRDRCSHHPNRRPGYAGPTALRDFTVDIDLVDAGPLDRLLELDLPTYSPGDGVAATVRACNRRTTPVVMEFPFTDWFVVTAENEHRAGDDWIWFYDPDHHAEEFERSFDPAYERPRGYHHPRRYVFAGVGVQNVHYLDGDVSGPDQTVTWGAGECRTWDIPAWFQNNLRGGSSPDEEELWHAVPSANSSAFRAVPGRYRFAVQWGGVEHEIGFEPVRGVSSVFELRGLRLHVRTGKQTYAHGETVDIVLEACNESGEPFVVGNGGHDSFEINIRGTSPDGPGVTFSTVHGGQYRFTEDITWAARECREFQASWDQHLSDGWGADGEPTEGPLIEPDARMRWQPTVHWRQEGGYNQSRRPDAVFHIEP